MQVFNEKFYTPVTIKLETQEEFNLMWTITNYAGTISDVIKDNQYNKEELDDFLVSLWKRLDTVNKSINVY